jgi:hypothetical protein
VKLRKSETPSKFTRTDKLEVEREGIDNGEIKGMKVALVIF